MYRAFHYSSFNVWNENHTFIVYTHFSKKKTFLGDDVLEGEVSYIDPDKQLDEILKKVKEEGLQSLTDSERAYILKMSDRINRRRG